MTPELHPKLHRITFRRGTIWDARFTPDGNLIYGAAWDGKPVELFCEPSREHKSRPLGLPATGILAISARGELAVASNFKAEGFESSGMLGRAPMGGSAPRQIVDNVEYADWSADGDTLAIVRRVGGKSRLEYPLGKVIYETAGWLSDPRISRDGKWIAFLDHPFERDDSGAVAIVDQTGNKKTLTAAIRKRRGLGLVSGKRQ